MQRIIYFNHTLLQLGAAEFYPWHQDSSGCSMLDGRAANIAMCRDMA